MEENKEEIVQTDSALQSPAEQWSEPEKPEKTKSEKPEKSGKGLKIALALTSILALAGIGFGVYGFFIKKPSSQEVLETIKDDAKLETISSVTDVKEVDAKDVTEDKEVTITNQYVKDDLNRKISILTGISDIAKDDQSLIDNALAYNEVSNFYSRGFESSAEKATAVFQASKTFFTTNEGRYIDYDNSETASYIKTNFASELDYIKQTTYQTISYSLANKIYSSMFNETLPKESVSTNICGYHYTYIEASDSFLFDGSVIAGGCGGTGFSGILVRKDSYKAKSDEAYVYAKIAIASILSCDGDSGPYKLFNDFYNDNRSDAGNNQLDCKNVITEDIMLNGGGYLTSRPDSSVLDTAADYRFVFKKNPAT
ncbi:hypothetical protein IIZ77_02390, partial [Candidatus Saccharibacteria bacterium]|nr:hypothetical protein [Candidatus Saccharibacteria bacterium]